LVMSKTYCGLRRLCIAVLAFSALFLVLPRAQADNIIGLANNATACGGSTLCSTNGTTGYLNNGTGVAFNLSTINSWFQIDTTGTSFLAGQPVEPDGGAGNFLVVNNTGAIVTSFSLTLTDNFTLSTPGQQSGCTPGLPCENFQIHGGAANYFTVFNLTGPTCATGCGTNSANFTPNTVTYNWSGGTGIPIGATFDLNFASWNSSNFIVSTPEPSTLSLLATALLSFVCLIAWRKRVSQLA
jgi:hypothetical protein